jgi:polysaccharide biosynthesis transport protein
MRGGPHRLLGPPRRHWLLVLLLALLGAALALVWTLARPPVYEATASVLVRPVVQEGDRAPRLDMRSEAQAARSAEVAERVAKAFHTTATPEQLLDQVSVEVLASSWVLRISYAHSVPAMAQRGADAFSRTYLAYRRSSVAGQLRSLDAALTRQIADLTAKKQTQESILAPDAGATASERNAALQLREAYSTRIVDLDRQLRALRRVDPSPGTIIQPARLPTAPASPGSPRNLGLGVAAGLLLGVTGAFVRDRVDDRLRGRGDVAEQLDRPVLALIPTVPRWRRRSGRLGWRRRDPNSPVMLDEPDGPAAEGYRTLRIGVERQAARLGVAVVMVTSPAPGEGKSTTAANLALALAEAGRDVLLVSADLRRPRLHVLFGLPNSKGLGDLLTRDEHWAAEETGRRAASKLWSVVPHLWVMVSAPLPPSQSSLLGVRAMRDLLKSQRDQWELIVLDSPPVLAVPDALSLAPLVDGVLVVADARTTERASLKELHEQIEQVGGTILGAVLNRAQVRSGQYRYHA